MFDHLLNIDPDDDSAFVGLNKATPREIISAQEATADWLKELGVSDEDEALAKNTAQVQTARDAFKLVATNVETDAQRAKLLELKTPEAVRKMAGMLTAYDWHFVEQASQLRGYAVNKILEETLSPQASVRLRALQLLGNVTEVALFTQRTEITKYDMPASELENKLRERLKRWAVTTEATAPPTDVVEKQQEVSNHSLPKPAEVVVDDAPHTEDLLDELNDIQPGKKA